MCVCVSTCLNNRTGIIGLNETTSPIKFGEGDGELVNTKIKCCESFTRWLLHLPPQLFKIMCQLVCSPDVLKVVNMGREV